MKYAVLKDNRVIDILVINPAFLYQEVQYVEIADEVQVNVDMVYDEATGTFSEYIEQEAEPTQLDKIEANIDYLVLLNS